MQVSIEHFINCQSAICEIYKLHSELPTEISLNSNNIVVYGRQRYSDGLYDTDYKILAKYYPDCICVVTYTLIHKYRYYTFKADTTTQLLYFGTTQASYPVSVLVRPFHILDPDCMDCNWIRSIYDSLVQILSRMPIEETHVLQ